MQPSGGIDVFSPITSDSKIQEPVQSEFGKFIKKFFKFPLPPEPPDTFDILEQGLMISG